MQVPWAETDAARRQRFRIGGVSAHLCERMSTPAQIEQLRARAGHLRAVSGKIGGSRALTVHTFAGPDTWVGPTPQSCYDALLALRRQLQTQQQSLIDTARTFERRAAELEQQPPIPRMLV